MIGWLLDTNVVSEVARRNADARVLDWADRQPDDLLYISILTLGEYDQGIYNLATGSRLRMRIEAGVAAIEHRFAGRVISVSDAIVRRWGRISGAIQYVTGKAPPVVDTLLAATAIEHDLCLVTRNVKDVEGSGALIFNPWTDDPGSISPV